MDITMRITYVVDTSIDEDRTYLEFWYKGVISKVSRGDYMYVVQNCDFKEWEQENIDVGCPRVQSHSNKRVTKS